MCTTLGAPWLETRHFWISELEYMNKYMKLVYKGLKESNDSSIDSMNNATCNLNMLLKQLYNLIIVNIFNICDTCWRYLKH